VADPYRFFTNLSGLSQALFAKVFLQVRLRSLKKFVSRSETRTAREHHDFVWSSPNRWRAGRPRDHCACVRELTREECALGGVKKVLGALNVMHLRTPESAILSAVIFNALIIIALIPLALRGVRYRPLGAAAPFQRNLLRDPLYVSAQGCERRLLSCHASEPQRVPWVNRASMFWN
jgi:hypothetical protein